MLCITLELEHPETFDAISVDVDYTYTPGTPARLCGAPEDCYPGEDEEFEIHNVQNAVTCEGYQDESVWLDEEIIEAIKHEASND